MKIQLLISAASLALAGSLLAQTTQEEKLSQAMENLQKILQDRQAALATAGTAPGAALQLLPPGVQMIPIEEAAPMVSGHPYSATARQITLSPDGQHVDRSHTATIYRDDQGRMRREDERSNIVSILDPIAGVSYSLDAERKVATKHAMAPAMIANQTKVPTQSPLEIATAQARNRTNMTVEDLGTQVVNGVSAQGVRVSTVIPVGSIGNDRELRTVVDRWVSPDLHVLVKSVTTDSRSGTVKYDLTNLVLASPDASLFQVPAGYAVEEGAGRGGRGAAGAPIPRAKQ